MAKYFFIGASRDHVLRGKAGGFAQAGHGRKDYISTPAKGDWVVFYSSKDKLENGMPLQKFTAIGKFADEEPYQVKSSSSFKPYRRKVDFISAKETSIRPLLNDLGFIKNKQRWGLYIISGFREIPEKDFQVIKNAMQ